MSRRALSGENQVKSGVGAPPICSLVHNWRDGIPPILILPDSKSKSVWKTLEIPSSSEKIVYTTELGSKKINLNFTLNELRFKRKNGNFESFGEFN